MKRDKGNKNLNPRVSLLDLISSEELQEVQDSFSEVANVTMRTVDVNGRNLTSPSNLPALCAEEKLCRHCLPAFLGGEGIVDEDFSFECLPGLKSYLVPLKMTLTKTASVILGYMVVGPVIFMKRKAREEYKEAAALMDSDLEQLWSFVLELRVFSHKGICSLLDMIGSMTGRILNLAYAKMAMQKKLRTVSLPENRYSATGELDEFVELFLDFVMEMTRGSKGSIMLMDKKKRALRIKAACGLPEDVVRSTFVKLGDGIAGLAAEMKKPFLISENSVDQHISERLSKPELFSSLVVPIKCRDNVYGVINVSSDKARPVSFSEETLALLTRAAGLAGVAMERFQN